ncbi:KPN_02809 family neutral zinc metallopeptidase [Loktanella salsilacus]|jgi:predicted metalloprotease|uniref:KPN_02809 family neutral zinc metallopeptidase n=1 Tax=Loktanella salsilacus TaxID=195913 RepID=UPI0020B784E6|nr:neutral zinc metallopeptidase [Loktanella salsilacus]UTH45935.1 neutral zinc metallopeptidase [Loktanella salsilacus]
MKWQGRRVSRNIERRSGGGGGRAIGGIGGIGGVLILLLGWYFGVDVSGIVGSTGGSSTQQVDTGQITEADPEVEQFVGVVLADTEDVWAAIFNAQVDGAYVPPKLVLFDGITRSACGNASAQTGPFYCPSDQDVYLDTAFFRTMQQQLGAGGDFAAAYVIAHEVGHHVQDELGILGQTNSMRARMSEADSNALSVRIELQADCYAGIWAQGTQAMNGTLEPGDIDEAMNAAARIGDDALQRNAGQAVSPDNFTHGTSAQRQRWFMRGYESGNMTDCDTFSATQL